jgi:hypothetical protein
MDAPDRRQPLSVALMTLAALTFVAASLIHSGFVTSLDPLPAAAIAEGLIAVVLAVGVAAAASGWPAARWLAPATTVFAILGTLLGLSIVLREQRTGDIVYHVTVLVVLIAALVLRLGRGSLSPAR